MPTPILQIDPGWYTYDYPVTSDMLAQLRAMQTKYQGRWFTRTSWNGDAGKYDKSRHEAILIQVVQSIWWELPRWPVPAPKGAATTLQDIANLPEPSDELIQMIQDITGSAFEYFKQFGKAAKKAVENTASNTISATTLLIWGGAAVLLYNLYRATNVR